MAVRLSIAFDTTAESWMNQQVQYDLWQAEQGRDQLKVTRLTVAERIVRKLEKARHWTIKHELQTLRGAIQWLVTLGIRLIRILIGQRRI